MSEFPNPCPAGGVFADPDIGRCDWCGSEEGRRRRTSRGWLCDDCRAETERRAS